MQGVRLLVNDIVYGSHELTDSVVVELIKSNAVQRLKRIAQYGLPDKWYHKNGFSRFEHSIGVTILLDRLGASIEEKIAGVLHDVSHTAFSHVVDWVVGSSEREDFQDKALPQFLSSNDELKGILDKYGYGVSLFFNTEDFHLLDRSHPDLCADRVDYALREMAYDGNAKEVALCSGSLMNLDGRIHFNSFESARTFGINYLKLQNEHWAGEQATNRYLVLSTVLKEAMDKKYIEFDDLFVDDMHVIEKLEDAKDKSITDKLESLKNGTFQLAKTGKKLRYVDPTFIRNGIIVRLSDADENFRRTLSSTRASR